MGSFYHSNKKELRAAVDYAVQSTGVTSYQNRPYGKLSGVERQSDIARTLVNTPKILFLDEPTTGLDHRLGRMYGKQSNYVKKKHDNLFYHPLYGGSSQGRLCYRN